MPSKSWVARWNNLDNKLPGIYAIKILNELDNYEGEQGYDYDPQPKKKRGVNDGLYSDPD